MPWHQVSFYGLSWPQSQFFLIVSLVDLFWILASDILEACLNNSRGPELPELSPWKVFMAIKTPTEVLTEPLKLFTEIENMVSISGLQKEQEKKKAKMAEAKWEKKKKWAKEW